MNQADYVRALNRATGARWVVEACRRKVMRGLLEGTRSGEVG